MIFRLLQQLSVQLLCAMWLYVARRAFIVQEYHCYCVDPKYVSSVLSYWNHPISLRYKAFISQLRLCQGKII